MKLEEFVEKAEKTVNEFRQFCMEQQKQHPKLWAKNVDRSEAAWWEHFKAYIEDLED